MKKSRNKEATRFDMFNLICLTNIENIAQNSNSFNYFLKVFNKLRYFPDYSPFRLLQKKILKDKFSLDIVA